MSGKVDLWFERALRETGHETKPSDIQKQRMLAHARSGAPGALDARERFNRLLTVYPWRFAFGVSIVQTALCALIWRAGYTNFVIGLMIGG